MRTVSIVGARPQFIKLAPISRAMSDPKIDGIEDIIVHTGQHYDPGMSDIFFEELKIPKPAVDLAVGSGSHGVQTARMLESIEKVLFEYEPDMVVTYGDTNSTVAASLAAAKLNIPLAHIEAGLRSFNRDMPEEVNRIVADHVSELLFAPTQTAMNNLRIENLGSRSTLVGDVMLDAVLFNRELAATQSTIRNRENLENISYAVATLHRASNTDTTSLQDILDTLNHIATESLRILFPVHPRTLARIDVDCPRWKPCSALRLLDPVGYLDMLQLLADAKLVLTDSGGLQKEAFFVGTPCITLREETEWPETIDNGANILAGSDRAKIIDAAESFLGSGLNRKALSDRARDVFGNGSAASNIVREIVSFTRS